MTTTSRSPEPGTNAGQNSTGQNSIAWGYCRVSTTDQHAEAQADALTSAGARRCWADAGVSGGTPLLDRPAMRELLSVAAPEDVVLVTKLDRAFRSLPDLLASTHELLERGISIRALDGSIDTRDNSPTGELTRSVLGAVASWERAIVSARTREALEHRRREGVVLGRPRLLTPDDIERARVWRADGWSYARIGRRLGCSDRAIRRILS